MPGMITARVRPLMVLAWMLLCVGQVHAQSDRISCLGRVEPLGGVIILAGPSGTSGRSAVMAEMRVKEGEWVEPEQVLAVLDDYKLRSAEIGRQEALVEDVQVRLKRLQNLSRTQSTSRAKLDEADYELRALEADLRVFQARQEMSLVRSPLQAQVLKIHAEPGERVGPEGVLELGKTDRMSVIAEVYETDIGKISIGQQAVINSPALQQAVNGKVTFIALQVGRMDVLDTDPVAKADARVVEVTIELEEHAQLQSLTNLQVDVEIVL